MKYVMKKIAKISSLFLCLLFTGTLFAKRLKNPPVVLPTSVVGEWYSESGTGEYKGLLIHQDFIEYGYRAYMYQKIKRNTDTSYTFSATDMKGNSLDGEIRIVSKNSIQLRRGNESFKTYSLRKEPKGSKHVSLKEVPELFKKKWFKTNGSNTLEFHLSAKKFKFRNITYKIEEIVDFKSNGKDEYRFVVKNKKTYWMFYFKNWTDSYLQVGFNGEMGDLYKANKAYPNGRIKNFSEYATSINGKRYLSSKKNAVLVPKKVSNWIDEELAKVTEKPLQDFKSDDFFKKENAKLIGYLKGYDASLDFATGIIYMGNDITNEDFPIVIQIHPDGRFEADLPINIPLYSHFVIKGKWIPFYLEPGQTLSITLDLFELMQIDRIASFENKLKNLEFEGQLAGVNKDLLGFSTKIDHRVYDRKNLKTQLPEEFKREEQIVLQENLEALLHYKTEYINSHLKVQKRVFGNLEKQVKATATVLSPKSLVIIRNKILLQSATRMFDFIMNRGNEARRDTTNVVLKVKEEISYYDFLKKMPLNDQSLLVSNEFGSFINRFEFSTPLSIYPKLSRRLFKAEKSFLDYLKEINAKLTKEEIKLQVVINNNDNDQEFYKNNKEELKKFYKKYTKGWKKYMDTYYYKEQSKWLESKEISMEKWKLRDSVLTNKLGLEKSLVYNIAKVRMLQHDIKNSNIGQAENYWNRLKTNINNPFLKEEGTRILHKIHPVEKVLSYKLPNTKAASVFKEIIAPFKGKVLFVDFWATSCGPCVGGIERMKEIRKKHKGNKDFVFVFITDERSSPIGRYNDFVQKQELKNIYRLPLDDYNYLRQLFKFNGIPRYVVIAKNGEVLNDDFPMYNFSFKLKEVLKKSDQLEKKNL